MPACWCGNVNLRCCRVYMPQLAVEYVVILCWISY
jgi:hypothetical protein